MKSITRRVFIYNAGAASAAACSPGLIALNDAQLPFDTRREEGKVAVLDDFETRESLKNWVGKITLSREHPSHGKQSLKVDLSTDGLSTEKLPKDLLDSFFEHANISRAVRFTDPAGQRIWQLEARSLRQGRDWLLSIVNHGATTAMVKLDWPAEPRSLKDLRGGESIAPDAIIALAPRETRLIRVE